MKNFDSCLELVVEGCMKNGGSSMELVADKWWQEYRAVSRIMVAAV